MSSKSTVRYTKDFHLYMDYMDEFGGPHAYLRIDNGLVKSLVVQTHGSGLSVLVRLPPEVFPILRPDIAKVLRHSSRPLDAKGVDRKLRGLWKVLGVKVPPTRALVGSEPPKKRPVRSPDPGSN
jgi:hypothetical protein